PARTPSETVPSWHPDVRIAQLSSVPATGAASRSAPVYAPRGSDSNSVISASADAFGAPVTDPGGNVARNNSVSPTAPARVPSTVESRCHTPGAGRTASGSGTWTLPAVHTRPRSLRTRSVTSTFSATSLGDVRSASARCSSAAPRRGIVPLIGDERTLRPRRDRNSSGDNDTTAPQSPAR